MMKPIVTALIGLGVQVGVPLIAHAEDEGSDRALLQVGKHRAVWTAQPGRTPANHSVDGPLMGNGDMKVAIGGPAGAQQYFLAKNDLWRLKSLEDHASPVPFGQLAIRIPELDGASYRLEQRWDAPETIGSFTRDGVTVRMRSWVAATQNLLILGLEAEGRPVGAEALLRVASGRGSETKVKRQGDLIFGQRTFIDDVDIPSGVAVACKVVGVDTTPAAGGSSDSAVVAARSETFPVQIGREQYGGGRLEFHGTLDDLRVYGRALNAAEMKALSSGVAPEGAAHVWTMDEALGAGSTVKIAPGKIGNAWHFNGDETSFHDCGKIEIPVEPVTVACWIKIDDIDRREGNYILSCGEWNKGISLGLSKGKLRFAFRGQHVDTAVLPEGQWIHVGGSWDGLGFKAYVDGQEVGRAGTSFEEEGARFTLEPGKPVTLLVSMDSIFKSESYAEDVLESLTETPDLAVVKRAHARWWADYWAKSWVEIGDPEIEKAYYRSLYGMGSCSRDPRFSPGLFGWVTTDTPRWFGDYHLNYNHVAPFYGLYSANRFEQGDPQDAPLLDFRERGRYYAKAVFGEAMRGVYYPVGIGPLGIETTYLGSPDKGRHNRHVDKGGLFFGQRSNAAYSLVNIAQRWRTTRSPEYGRETYPFVLDVIEFWEDYLKWEPSSAKEEPPTGAGRYVIYADSFQEQTGEDTNPVYSLALVRNSFDLAIDMSEELGVDADLRDKWRHILNHLSSWTTHELDGKTVFRNTEEGPHWRHGTSGIQHIYPGNAIGLDSDPRWLEIAHNTITAMQRWDGYNGSNSFFPAAVRIGYDPEMILERLRAYARKQYPNGFIVGNPHGIENFSTTPNTINEMLCMSHVSVGEIPGAHLLRVFPIWPKNKDATFINIRAWGAFLVSSELKGGDVIYVRITSERGRPCTMRNPWPGRSVVVTGQNRRDIVSGNTLEFDTDIGEQIVLTCHE